MFFDIYGREERAGVGSKLWGRTESFRLEIDLVKTGQSHGGRETLEANAEPWRGGE